MLDSPTCCLSLKRAAFERFGPFRESGYCSDTAFNWRASAAGQPPLFVPTLQVAHTNLTALPGLLRKLAMHGRAFAQMRLAEQQLPAIRVAVLALAALPVLPALLGARILVRVLRSSVPFARFLLALPVLVAALFAWSWGEATGYAEHLVCVPDTSDRQAGAA
jgi:GT2 family glycosyltransferase